MDQLRDDIEILEEEIATLLAPFMEKNDLVGASNLCFNCIVELGSGAESTDPKVNMRRYLYAIQMLQLQIEAKHLKQPEIDQVLRIAETCLHMAGIKEGSKRGYLFEELYNCKSNLLQQSNRPMGAQWELLIGKRFLSTDFFWINSAISETMAIFHMGYAFEARRGLEKLIDFHLDKEQSIFLHLQLIKAARLSGALSDAEKWIEKIIDDPSLDERTRELIHWESSWLNMTKSGSIEEFAKKLSSRREFPDEPYLSLIFLLYHSHPNAINLLKDLPSLSTVRKRHGKKRSEPEKLLFDILELFQFLYDPQVAIKARLSRVTDLIDRLHILHPEYQLLFFLGLARWAFRFKQKGFINFALNKYRNLSRTMTNDQTDDVLAMIADMRNTGSALWYMSEYFDARETLPSKTMSRPIGRRMNVWMSYAKLGWQLLSPEQSPCEKAIRFVQMVLQRSIEESVTLTGPYAKCLQIMSQGAVALLGMDDKLNQDLAKVYCFIPGDSAISLEHTFRAEFGKELDEVFSSWDSQPFSGGSISQVFRATLKSGREVAIKVKYPEIEASAKKDFRVLKKWVWPVLGRFSKSFSKENLETWESIFLGELDFKAEVSIMQKFRSIFINDPEVVIPEPLAEYSSANCITMDYYDGASLEYISEHGSREEKDNAGKIIFRFYLKSAFGHNLHKVDHFSANFRFAGGKVIFLDFGRILVMPSLRNEEYISAVWNMFFDPEKFVLPIPEEVRVVEKELSDFIDTHLVLKVDREDPTLIIPDAAGFRDDLIETFFKILPKVKEFTVKNYPEIEGWFGLLYILSMLDTRHTWHREMKGFFKSQFPDRHKKAG